MNLWVSEYGRITVGESARTLPEGNLEVATDQFAALKSLLTIDDSEVEEDINFEPFFKFGMYKGRECLRVQNYVGVIRCGDVQIEFLPKISKTKVDPEDARALLVKMLVELEDSPFRESNQASLQAQKMPLFEILFRDYLEKVTNTVRRGLARAYVQLEGNLFFLRGKLKVSEHIRRNVGLHNRLYCEFDEYELDRPANRLLRATLETVQRLSTNPQNQRICREVLIHFEGVPSSQDIRSDFSAIVRDRNISHYHLSLQTARLILLGLNPLTRAGDNQATAMLFPMERVFEDYVAAKLVRQFPDWRIRTQLRRSYLIEEHLDMRMFALQPDLEMSRRGVRLVLDTKWKLIDENDHKKKYHVSQADIYQLYAYEQKYLGDQSLKISVLIYPRTENFKASLRPFWYSGHTEVLFVTPFDCDSAELLVPDELDVVLAESVKRKQSSV